MVQGERCQAWGHSALTKAGEDKTDEEGTPVDHGSKEAKLKRARKTEDEGGMQDRAQSLGTCYSLHLENSSERSLRPSLAKAGLG